MHTEHKDVLARLQDWRRDFHRYPETAWCEYRTTSLIARALADLGYRITLGDGILSHASIMGRQVDIEREVARAIAQGGDRQWLDNMTLPGLIAELDTGRPGPCLALRVDLDAVGIGETDRHDHPPHQAGFSSAVSGQMHACAHDGHAAIGVVLGQTLAACRDQLCGRIKLVFQPAEEGCRAGKALAESGCLDDIDQMLAIHLGIHATTGELVVNPQEFLSSTKFDVEFLGKPAHAGLEPNAGANALAAACFAVGQMLAIPPHRDGLTRLNIGHMVGGQERNVIPAWAQLKGETRGATAQLNEYVFSGVQRIVQGAAMAQGVDYRIRRQGEAISIHNTPALVHALTLLGDELGFTVIHSRPFGASDDAGFAIDRVQRRGGQAAYLVVGADLQAGHHTDRFDFDEQAMLRAWTLLQAFFTRGLDRQKFIPAE